eukprot:GHVU01059225.1.p1 GENE.GHVU01059225.1~~GHVU01059225.1.p1  ORF type:complete len:100 (-),score=1.11 GHVU01059225.1:401-700(-)
MLGPFDDADFGECRSQCDGFDSVAYAAISSEVCQFVWAYVRAFSTGKTRRSILPDVAPVAEPLFSRPGIDRMDPGLPSQGAGNPGLLNVYMFCGRNIPS